MVKNIVNYIKGLNEQKIKPKGFAFFGTYFVIFLVGCVIGWVYEEIFYFVVENRLVNSGFMYGPYLPVYGFGALLMLLFLKPIKKFPPLVFILSMLVTGIWEYVTGYLMYKIWQTRWWDYTGKFLNIDGYVCLRSVLTFAIGGIALIYFIEPLAIRICTAMPKKRLAIICIVPSVIILTDLVISLIFRVPAAVI